MAETRHVQAGGTPSEEDLTRNLTQWAEAFEELADRVDGFVAQSESAFLGFSGHLQQGMLRAGELARTAAEAVQGISGHDFQDILDNIASHVRQLEGDLSTAIGGTDRMTERLRELRETLRSVLRARRDFGELVTMLRTLGVAARIQSSHLDRSEGGFMTLSEHVKELAIQVDRRFRVVVDRSERLQRDIDSALALACEAREANSGLLHESLKRVADRLGDMRRTGVVAEEVGQAVALGSKDISARITEIVMAMQFQDITRQRLEAVRDALRDGSRSLREGSEDPGERAARARLVAGLQRRQLRSATETFSSEMTQLLDNTRSVVRALTALQDRIVGLGVEAEGREGSIFLRVRRELDGIVNGASRMADEGRKLSGTLEASLQTATEMVGYVGDIDAIGTDLRNLALNAVVRSTATGDRGRPLVVIAEAIQEQSDESRRLTAHVSDRLRETGLAATRLGRLAGEVAQAAEAGREVSSGSLDPLIGRLYETDDRFNEHMRTINVGVRELVGSLSAASQGLTLHEELERVAEYVTGHFQRVEAETLAVPAPDELVSRLGLLSQDQARYAMSAQRDVHEAFTAGLSTADEGNEEITAEQDVGDVLFSDDAEVDLGDNVELF